MWWRFSRGNTKPSICWFLAQFNQSEVKNELNRRKLLPWTAAIHNWQIEDWGRKPAKRLRPRTCIATSEASVTPATGAVFPTWGSATLTIANYQPHDLMLWWCNAVICSLLTVNRKYRRMENMMIWISFCGRILYTPRSNQESVDGVCQLMTLAMDNGNRI